MWQSIFVDLLTMVGIFAAGFLLGRGTWPRRYRVMKRRWLEKRHEVRHLREQLYGEGSNRMQLDDVAPPESEPSDEDFDPRPARQEPRARR